MKTSALLVSAMMFGTALAPVLSHAGEKQQGSMVPTGAGLYSRDACHVGHVPAPPSPAFVPGLSKGKFKFDDKCQGKLGLAKLSGLPLDDGVPGSGDEILCLLYFNSGGMCGTFLLRGAVLSGGKTNIKFQGAAELPPGLCPPPPTDAHVHGVECYSPDPGYSAAVACGAVGGVFTPFASDPSQGLCAPAGAYLPNPTSPVMAVQGVVF